MKKINFFGFVGFAFISGLLLGYFSYQIVNKSNKAIINRTYTEVANNIVRQNREAQKTVSDKEYSILHDGNMGSYNDLCTFYMRYGRMYNLLPFALYISNKYNNKFASLDVFYCLSFLTSDRRQAGYDYLSDLDEKTRQIALEYLKKAVAEGHPDAKIILGEYYIKGEYVEKNEQLGNKLREDGGYAK
jgi:TPR repeat protein